MLSLTKPVPALMPQLFWETKFPLIFTSSLVESIPYTPLKEALFPEITDRPEFWRTIPFAPYCTVFLDIVMPGEESATIPSLGKLELPRKADTLFPTIEIPLELCE